MGYQWYLVRTKPSRERYVSGQLTRVAREVFLPLLSTAGRIPRPDHRSVPLFPQYVFVRCDLALHYFHIRYAPGVASFVTAGADPLLVAEQIVESVRARCIDNVVQLNQPSFRKGDLVQIMTGPFRGFEAVFERYLSGAERVAILLNALEGHNCRIVLRAQSIARS